MCDVSGEGALDDGVWWGAHVWGEGGAILPVTCDLWGMILLATHHSPFHFQYLPCVSWWHVTGTTIKRQIFEVQFLRIRLRPRN